MTFDSLSDMTPVVNLAQCLPDHHYGDAVFAGQHP